MRPDEVPGVASRLLQAFKKYYEIVSPETIERRAAGEVPMEELIEDWAIGTDPAIHRDKINLLFESGVTIVNIHAGQADQRRVIDF